ncbi:CbtB-domain containing protein [Nocardioides mangrovicus]|uniref:CbtB-domain containing protein n=1 Tax=Nocardioides mangrovicus TaxID=2478913 RepID=A0A3L8P6P2_9ACTN|nr:CbtB-domain containing protein [Nocardioides mangrovicus]RLV50383.1 CbtB-domain containing protein [Nocardioides mangrovicus]
MSNAAAQTHPQAVTVPVVTAQTKSIAILLATALIAFGVYYFIGIDQGAWSVFGKSMVIHEFFHDGRHFLGFPCH